MWRKGRVNRVYCYIRLNQEEDRIGDLRRKLDDFILRNQIYVYEIIVDIISSSTLAETRVKFSRLLEELRAGDILITMRYLDLGRYVQDSLETILFLCNKNIKVVILEIPLLGNWNFILEDRYYDDGIRLLVLLKTELAVKSKEILSLNTKLGMKISIEKNNKKPGHPIAAVPKNFKKKYKDYKNGVYGGMILKDFCRICGISKTCYYNWERKLREAGEID